MPAIPGVFRPCGRPTTQIRTVIYVEEGLFALNAWKYDVRAQAVIRYIILALMEIRQDYTVIGRPIDNIRSSGPESTL